MKPNITIEYCTKCRWLLRAAYISQELLSTYEDDLERVALKPGKENGVFRIYIDDEVLFDRKEYEGFPEIKLLKRWVRDKIEPEKDLGHVDR